MRRRNSKGSETYLKTFVLFSGSIYLSRKLSQQYRTEKPSRSENVSYSLGSKPFWLFFLHWGKGQYEVAQHACHYLLKSNSPVHSKIKAEELKEGFYHMYRGERPIFHPFCIQQPFWLLALCSVPLLFKSSQFWLVQLQRSSFKKEIDNRIKLLIIRSGSVIITDVWLKLK